MKGNSITQKGPNVGGKKVENGHQHFSQHVDIRPNTRHFTETAHEVIAIIEMFLYA